jgi:hypothetical protein
MKEVDRIPDWLVEGLSKKKLGEGNVTPFWQKINVGDRSLIVRVAGRKVVGSIPVQFVRKRG